ncbi:MAG: aminoglycoside phosphotransferase family protein [Christensenellaceae bacterium]|jgi:aminoglycoside phosphotransferase (APT) family kinase protein|nr:aminoglycoside phosphotransferase family protein [Christensenellaceae bacterium]
MEKNFFDLNDDFCAIVRENIKGVYAAEKIATGRTNYVYYAYKKGFLGLGKKTFVARFPRTDFFMRALEKEIEATTEIKQYLVLKTPIYKKALKDGRAFSLHELVSGEPLNDVYETLTTAEKQVIAGDIAKYIFDIQNLTDKIKTTETLSTFLTELSYINGNEDYDYSVLDTLKKQEGEKLVLVHGDLNPCNLIIDKKKRLCGVLDYAFVSSSSPFVDLGRLTGRMDKEFNEMLIESFEKISGLKFKRKELTELNKMWKYVEADYMEYMTREHADFDYPVKC